MKLATHIVDTINRATINTTFAFAIEMARLGLKIFPLEPMGKKPLDRGWQALATDDETQIRAWFTQRPTMNYGIACGSSGIVVVDLDMKNATDGIANWSKIAVANGFEPSFEVGTPSGGMHIYYWATGLRNSQSAVAPGVDTRGDGGYVVGPGSITREGMYFPSLPGYFPDHGDIREASEALKSALKSRKASKNLVLESVLTAPGVPVSKPLTKPQAEVLGLNIVKLLSAPEGRRNGTLNDCAFALGALVREGALEKSQAESVLLSSALTIGLGASEAKATINSGLESGALKGDPVSTGKSKYVALDLLHWLSQDHPEPALIGCGGVLYTPALTWVMGEPASGKSFLCLQWALDVMNAGRSVVWLDEEAGPRDTVGKLHALGATDEQLQKFFKYLPPENRSLQSEALELRQFVEQNDPGLVVMDSAAALLANADINENDNSPVGAFFNKAVLPLVKELEIPTIVIDHKTKNNTNSSYARGASSKLGVVDLALNVELKVGFSKEQSGSFDVKVNKDRSGIHTVGKTWRVEVAISPGSVRIQFGQPKVPTDTKKTEPDLDQLILDYVEENPGSSKGAVEISVKGASNQKIRSAIKNLLDAGYLNFTAIGKSKGLFISDASRDY